MGNSHPSSGKVILSNGSVFTYSEPITAAELMLDHPHNVVVEFTREFVSKGKRPTPLPADWRLDRKKLYLMLPIRNGKVAKLTPEIARKLLIGIKSISKPDPFSSFTGIVPFVARIRSRGNAVVVSESKFSPESDDFDDKNDAQPEFLSRQLSGKGWKPSLDTILERRGFQVKK